MAWTESQNLAIVQTQLDDVFMQEWEYDTNYPGIATANTAKLFKQEDWDRAVYNEEIFKGSPLFPAIAETQVVPQSTPAVANLLATRIQDYGQSIFLSKNLFDDNLHGVWNKAVKDFAMKTRLTSDNTGFGLFRNGFTTQLTADGAPVFGTHTLISGGTVVNFISGASSALSSVSLNTAIIGLQTQVDQSNVIQGNQPSCLVVPPELFKTAIEVTESALVSDAGGNGGSNVSNAINVYRSAYGIEVYTSPYLGAAAGGSATAWYLLARNHDFTRLKRQGVETKLVPWEYSDNRQYKYTANFREAFKVADYVGSFASLGV